MKITLIAYWELGLTIAGAIFCPRLLFLLSARSPYGDRPVVGMIGFTSNALASSRPQISPEASRLILGNRDGNIAALLEELGLNHKAIYLRSTMREGMPQALNSFKRRRRCPADKRENTPQADRPLR